MSNPNILLPGMPARPSPAANAADQGGLPSKPQMAGASRVGTQAANRYMDTFRDQHRLSGHPIFASGRPWCGSRERAANKGFPDGFVGEPQPGEYVATGPEIVGQPGLPPEPTQTRDDRLASFATAWDAPWMPKIKYFDFNWRSKRITIRYDRMVGDYRMSQRQYYEAANRVSASMRGPQIRVGEIPDLSVCAIVGYPDTKEDPRVPEAAQAGDQWLLYGVGDVNAKLARLLGLWVDETTSMIAPQVAPVPVASAASVQTVLGADPAALAIMIQQAIEAHEAKKKADNQAKMAKTRAARKPKTVHA